MSTARFLWHLTFYRRNLYLSNIVLWTLVYLAPLLPGMVLQRFFDELEAGTIGDSEALRLVAVLMGFGAGQLVLIYVAIWSSVRDEFFNSGLLRRNVFARILELPGAQALKEPTGEMVSRFRDDAREIATC